MKVLMFGWEFPPHISGGLGTACFGLTKSLAHEGTKVLFVVPKAHGDEEFNIINASDVLVNEHNKSIATDFSPTTLRKSRIQVIGIQSGIKPYSFGSESESYAIEEWSYEVASGNPSQKPTTVKAKKYKFSGAYGAQLLTEVANYSQVAGALARHHSFDVIHAHDWLTYQAGVSAKDASGKPLVVHVHATEYDRSEQIDTRVYSIEREGLERADHVVAVSNWTKRILVSKYQISAAKISVVHNGIVGRKFQFAKPSNRRENQVVTFLGRITYQKGPQYFIDAAYKVLLRLPDAHFIMAGSGDLLPAMIERVAKLRLSSRFHFTGFMKGQQLDQVWSVTNLYIMPSVSEPFGIAPLEAIQAGIPVIISKQSGVAEVMPHAITVNFWEIDSLANAIYHVLTHQSLSNTLRKKSRQSLKRITWNKAAKKINTIYNELTPQH